jgi:hypothetical protein
MRIIRLILRTQTLAAVIPEYGFYSISGEGMHYSSASVG